MFVSKESRRGKSETFILMFVLLNNKISLFYQRVTIFLKSKFFVHSLSANKTINCELCKMFMIQVNGVLTSPDNEKAVSFLRHPLCNIIFVLVVLFIFCRPQIAIFPIIKVCPRFLIKGISSITPLIQIII